MSEYYEGAECDGCGKEMNAQEAARADNISQFIWFCDDCLANFSVVVEDYDEYWA